MRRIDNIVIHCTATPQSAKVSSIVRYWKDVLGWKNVGYHKIIDSDGCVHILAPDSDVTNGVSGHNSRSLHVAYIGGQHRDDRTEAQKEALKHVVNEWKGLYPNARILGHRDFKGATKACPNFEVSAEF
jgi:N-acetylmuramoyl-L-alanine amidase